MSDSQADRNQADHSRPQRNRREILTAGAAASAELALAGVDAFADEGCERPARGPHAYYFPNLVVETHDRRRVLFYDDLLAGRTVLVNCFSIAHDVHYPVTANLAQVQEHLGERLGRGVFMVSITTDPENDTPERLGDFARRHGARPGWTFITGAREDMELLRGRFFSHGLGDPPEGGTPDCSLGLVRYGNEAIGLWGAVPAKADPAWIAARLGWITPRVPVAGAPRRRGPVPGDPFPGAVVERS